MLCVRTRRSARIPARPQRSSHSRGSAPPAAPCASSASGRRGCYAGSVGAFQKLRLGAAIEFVLICLAAPAGAVVFSDDFDRASLGPDWQIANGSFSIIADALAEDSGAMFLTGQLAYVAGSTAGADQYAKLQLAQQNGATWGFIFRLGDPTGRHYQVHLPPGGVEWRWESYDPGFVQREGDCIGDQEPVDGDWIGVQVEGAGASTLVSVWRWNADPGPDPLVDWGPPDCQMQQDPSAPAPDVGTGLGIRAFTGSSTQLAFADDWTAGDAPGPIPPLPNPGMRNIIEILDASGGGTAATLGDPDGLALDSQGNLYVAACGSSASNQGLFRITPALDVSLVIDSSGDGMNPADCFVGVDVDSQDNVYVATFQSDRVFRVTPAGVVTMILDASGAGVPGSLDGPLDVAVDPSDNVFVSGFFSDNVFRVTPLGVVTEVMDATGDGGTPLDGPFGLATDSLGNLFVAGFGVGSDAVFRRTPGGALSVVIDATGDGGTQPLTGPHSLAVDPADNLYVTGNMSNNVFRVTQTGTITAIADINGDGMGSLMENPTGLDVDDEGVAYVSAFLSNNAFRIEPDGTITEILDVTGDGVSEYRTPSDFNLCVDPVTGDVYTAGTGSHNVFKILPEPGGACALLAGAACLAALCARRAKPQRAVGAALRLSSDLGPSGHPSIRRRPRTAARSTG